MNSSVNQSREPRREFTKTRSVIGNNPSKSLTSGYSSRYTTGIQEDKKQYE
jgi:hypothetical protein